jgi:hypothetical protein
MLFLAFLSEITVSFRGHVTAVINQSFLNRYICILLT